MPRNKKEPVADWTGEQIKQAAIIQRSDIGRALALIAEGSRELAEMVEAEEEEPTP